MTPEEARAIIKANMKDMAKIVQDAMGVLHPELRESEDERMCTRCIDLLRKVSAYSGEEYLGVEIADCIIWLQALIKKLKESLHITEICKEDADSFTDEDERIRKKLIEIIGYFRSRGIDHQLCEEFLSYLERQKEQKPDDDVLHRTYQEGFDDGLNYRLKGIGVRYVKDEQKPADRFEEAREKYQVEWSDNDDRLIGFIFDLLNDLAWRKDWAMSKEECLERLKSIRPQPKQEWSEEDEKMRINILNALTPQLVYSVGKGTCTGTSTYKYDDEIKWLKSLRPSWKPSEEQMRALEECGECKRCVKELYEQLKKLM